MGLYYSSTVAPCGIRPGQSMFVVGVNDYRGLYSKQKIPSELERFVVGV